MSFHIKAIVHKEFVLTGQTVPHITVIFRGDCVKICEEDFAPNFGDRGLKPRIKVKKKRGGIVVTVQPLQRF
jgi:hypothetical protein